DHLGFRKLGELDELRARALGARLDLEGDLLAAVQAVEAVDAVTVEEVFLAVLCRDESEAAVGDEFLDGAGGCHWVSLFFLERCRPSDGLFEKDGDQPRDTALLSDQEFFTPSDRRPNLKSPPAYSRSVTSWTSEWRPSTVERTRST